MNVLEQIVLDIRNYAAITSALGRVECSNTLQVSLSESFDAKSSPTMIKEHGFVPSAVTGGVRRCRKFVGSKAGSFAIMKAKANRARRRSNREAIRLAVDFETLILDDGSNAYTDYDAC